MSLSRRAILLAAPTVSLGAAGAAVAAPGGEAAPNIIMFTSRRVKTTLPPVPITTPELGSGYIAYLELLDENNQPIGDGSVRGSIVDIIAGIPPKLVVQANAIYRLPDGEIHVSNMHLRLVPNTGVRHPIAITGGTNAYRTARGSGSIEYVAETQTKVVLNVMVDPPA